MSRPLIETDPAVGRNPLTLAVRPPMGHAVAHGLEDVAIYRAGPAEIKNARYAAHEKPE